MKELFSFLKPNALKMSIGLLIKFFGTVLDLFLPWALAHIIDVVAPKEDKTMIIVWGIVMVLCAVAAVVSNIVANRMAAAVARDTTRSIRHELFKKISYLTCSKIDYFGIPSLESRITSDTYHVHHCVGMMQRIGIRAPILLIGGICMTMSMEPVLTLVLMAVLPIMAIITVFISKKGIPLFENQQKSVDGLIKIVRENITGVRVIKALSKVEYEKSRFDNANKTVVSAEKKASLTMAVTNPVMNFLLNSGLAAVILVGAYRVNMGITSTGKIIAFLSYFTIILNSLLIITRIFTNFTKGIASMRRITEVLNAKNDMHIIDVPEQDGEYKIEFKNVSFSYYKKRKNIEDISFALKKGESIGIIGATGSGKTTVAAMLMRLYDVDKGSVLIDGKNVKSIDSDELYKKFGVVFQADTLFADSIKNNIDFERKLSADEIETALKISQAKEFCDALDDGIEYKLTQKGTNLSGGQKQRVLLARALAGNPEILILDDSSSALDYKTDLMLRTAIKEKMAEVTSVIIAQRISAIKNCTYIMMLDEGKIIGFGRHEDLMENCEEYAHIAKLQMGGE